ncbi:MAG: iron ABC transporter substrate-binding protein [Nanobdellota archaeon]
MRRVFVFVFLMILLAGCGVNEENAGGGSRQIVDMAGREVTMPEEVDEVVALEAGALRIITYLQATDMVVGVEEIEKTKILRPYILAHPELSELPSIGPMHGGDAELITARGPDVIFWTYTTAGEADDLQRKTGIPVVVLDYGDLGENRDVFYDSVDLTAKVLGKERRADEIKDYIDSTIEFFYDETYNISGGESVYIGGVSHRGAHGLASTEPDYTPFTFLNANNVAGGLGMEHAYVDPEKIIEWDPDKVFIDQGGLSLVRKDFSNETSKYFSLDAYEEGELYGLLPYNWYTTNYATVIANTYYVASVIYPEKFAGFDPEEKAGEVYRFFVGSDVYPVMEEKFGGFGKIEDV